VLVILALQFLTQLFYYIPKAALAAIIIAAVIFMIEYHVVVPIWKTKSEYISNAQRQPTFATCGSTKNTKKKTQVFEKCMNSITILVLGKT
jgi:hypothetical protein